MRRALFCSLAKSQGLIFVVLALAALTPAINAQTQITTGTIQGTVLDANGAAVPDAGVEVKNLGTNATRTTATDEEGRFIVLQLQPGLYNVTVTKSGFATLVAEKAEWQIRIWSPSRYTNPAEVVRQ